MSRANDAIARFEQRLTDELDRVGQGLRHDLADKAQPGPITAHARACLDEWLRLSVKDARLRRKARRGAPGHDPDRHITLRRLLGLPSPTRAI